MLKIASLQQQALHFIVQHIELYKENATKVPIPLIQNIIRALWVDVYKLPQIYSLLLQQSLSTYQWLECCLALNQAHTGVTHPRLKAVFKQIICKEQFHRGQATLFTISTAITSHSCDFLLALLALKKIDLLYAFRTDMPNEGQDTKYLHILKVILASPHRNLVLRLILASSILPLSATAILALAAWYNMYELIVPLIKAGVDFEIPDEHGLRPLHIAALTGHSEVLVRLIACGANVRALDVHGKDAWSHAISHRELYRGLKREDYETCLDYLKNALRETHTCTQPIIYSPATFLPWRIPPPTSKNPDPNIKSFCRIV